MNRRGQISSPLCQLQWIFWLIIFYSCAPKITSFSALPPTITKGDSVTLNWKIKGKPTLVFDQRKIAHSGNDSLEVLEFTLWVEKNKKEKHINRQISVLTEESMDNLIFATTDLKGDTLFASGIKDTILWNNFEIISVSSASKRTLSVVHNNIQSQLDSSGVISNAWDGSKYSGRWKIMTILTDAEKKDSSIIPGQLEIKAIIRPLK
ncbi:MAG: hypothetical protein ABI185_09260 [Ginsengibacter sp.]